MTMIRWQPRTGNEIARHYHWDPFADFDFLRRLAGARPFERWTPPIDVVEEPDRFRVHADLPGMKKDEIHLTLEGETLTIHGERKRESERFEGSFSRSLVLPAAVDSQKVEASYMNGVLEISIMKSDSARSRQIPIQG